MQLVATVFDFELANVKLIIKCLWIYSYVAIDGNYNLICLFLCVEFDAYMYVCAM